MPSATYMLFRQGIEQEKQIACTYGGHYRELCPLVLGHTKGEERVLAYQVGGETSKGSLRGKHDWKCFSIGNVSNPQLRDGRWDEGHRHTREQTCVRM